MAAEPPEDAGATESESGNSSMQQVLRLGRRIGIAIAGGAVVTAGVALLVLPGPGLVVIALGLGILSLEFQRPRVWLAQLKARGVDLKHRFDERRTRGKR